MANTIKFVTITEHLTIEECEKLTLKEVVERAGFQACRLVSLKGTDDSNVTLVAIQSVEMLDVESNATQG